MIKILQIVPSLPPDTNGLGDYALNIARPLFSKYEVKTEFLVGNPNWISSERPGHIDNFKVTAIESRQVSPTLKTINDYKIVLLHYVGYGYAKRGCPIWLISALQKYKRQSGNKLITMFHELYAKGSPLSSSFWLSPIQKNLVIRLVKISDTLITNSQNYFHTLNKITKSNKKYATKSYIKPVFSNIGEIQLVKPFQDKKNQLIVFGSASRREYLYSNFSTQISEVCKKLEVNEIVDIGNPFNSSLIVIPGTKVIQTGKLSNFDISEIMTNAKYGLIYSNGFLEKSTVFASYCAHGIVTINLSNNEITRETVHPNIHFVKYSFLNSCSSSILSTIASNAYYWYYNHNLSKQIKFYADLIKSESI